jgi:superfamily II DNA or RNA helicase
MVENSKAECIRKAINISKSQDFYKFDKKTFNAIKIKENLKISSPKLIVLLNKIAELDANDFKKYGKNFKHIIYSDLRSSLHGIKLIAAAFKAYGMNNVYDNKLELKIPNNNNNFALLSSLAVYEKPFSVKLKQKILNTFNSRPDNVYGEKIRYLLIDQGYKEGIDVFDVKYVHIFDDLLTPSDEKQVIGRGTRFCGQKGLNFHPEIGWPLHVFKYKLNLEKVKKYNVDDAFMLYVKESHIDFNKLLFAAELENICRFGAVDYEINKAIHEFGNEKEDNLEDKKIYLKYKKIEEFKIKDIYESLDELENKEFNLIKKAYNNFGGFKKTLSVINKKKHKFIDIKKTAKMNLILSSKLNFIDMRRYVRKFYNDCKWGNLKFKNKCIIEDDVKPSRIVNLTNSQKFVSRFFNPDSIYKGILFWHSVGTGKTCSAIATASSTFEKENYTILWVTRHTLKQDIWKNIFKDVCSATIKEKIKNGEKIPENAKAPLKYLDKKWIMPISYKQFTNLINKKNEFYKELVKRNGVRDPLKKTLIIIDEAHKLYSDDVPANEKPDMNALKKALYHSYKYSKKNSCKLILMSATPFTNNPMQLCKLLNLLKEDEYLPEIFEEFKQKYLNENYKFEKSTAKIFLDDISGYISYLNREKDARQFAYPVIYTENIDLSYNDKENLNSKFLLYNYFNDDIVDLIDININCAENIIDNFKNVIKIKKDVKTDIITQETALDKCLFKNDDNHHDNSSGNSSNRNGDSNGDSNGDNKEKMANFIKEILLLIKNKIKETKKQQKELEKEAKKQQKELDKEAKKTAKKLK